MDALDRKIINSLQGGFPLTPTPFADAAATLGTDEATLIARIERLHADQTISRFGPMYNAERLGGELTLCAMSVPAESWSRVVEIVNSFDEVAHNYERTHEYNMWFVIATAHVGRADEAIAEIEAATGLQIVNLPKEEEFFIGLRLAV